jgi:hypothetical protein
MTIVLTLFAVSSYLIHAYGIWHEVSGADSPLFANKKARIALLLTFPIAPLVIYPFFIIGLSYGLWEWLSKGK